MWRVKRRDTHRRRDDALDLAAGLAHDINNTLAAVVASIELAQSHAGEERRSAALSRALRLAVTGSELGELVLAAAPRDRPARAECTDLAAVIDGVVADCNGTFGPDIVVSKEALEPDTGAALGDVEADLADRLLRGVVCELRDRLPDGGHIRLSLRPGGDDAWDIVLAARPTDIPGEAVHLLEASQRAPARLRRAAIASLVRATGAAQKQVASIDESGAQQLAIIIRLPRSPPPGSDAATDTATHAPGDGQLVLAVDGDLAGLQRLHLMIESLGYAAASAVDAGEAIDLLAAGEPVMAVLSAKAQSGMIGQWLAKNGRTVDVVAFDEPMGRTMTREALAAMVDAALRNGHA